MLPSDLVEAGWVRHHYFRFNDAGQPCYCALGALYAADTDSSGIDLPFLTAGQVVKKAFAVFGEEKVLALAEDARAQLTERYPDMPHVTNLGAGLADWNDDVRTTQQDVVATLRRHGL